MSSTIFTCERRNLFLLVIFVYTDDNEKKHVVTNKRCGRRMYVVCLFNWHTMMTSLCTCVSWSWDFLLLLLLLLCSRTAEREGGRGSTRKSKSVPGFEIQRCISGYFFEKEKKKKTRNACCWCWSEVGDCCCCFRSFNASLRCPDSFSLLPFFSRSSSIGPVFFFLAFSCFFLRFPAFLFLFSFVFSPWVMSNLPALCV